MSTVSEIIVDSEALDNLQLMGVSLRPEMYDRRPDGRFNLRVDDRVRQKLDSLAVRWAVDHSTVIKVLKEANAQ